MKRLLLSVLIISFFFGGLKAQRGGGRGLIDRNDESESYLTFSLGPEYCYSDTQGKLWNQISLKDNDLTIGFRTIYANNFGYKVALSYSNFTGNDIGSIYSRRYSYTSNVLQLALQGEYSIKIGRSYYYKPTPNSIYAFLGLGALVSNANLNYDKNNPLGGYVYKPTYLAPVIPVGIGYQHHFSNNFLVGTEFNFRYPFSDYIDGFKPFKKVGKSGTINGSKSNDVMGGFSVTFSYLLGNDYLKRR